MGKIYFLPDYGILPNSEADCSAKLQELFDFVEDGSTVQFKTGNYFLSQIVRLRNRKNIKILGNRSHIITHYEPCGPKENSNNAFQFTECSDIEINGLFFDTDNPIGATGDVVGMDFENNTVDVKIYDEFPVTGYEHFCGTNSFDENGAPDYAFATYNNVLKAQEITLSDNTKRERLIGLDYDVVAEQTVRLKLEGAFPPREKCRLKIGHKINFRYEMYGHSVFTFAFCHRVLIKDVVIYSAASFGVTVEPRSSDFTFDNFCIRVNDGSTRLKAINADGIHILGLYGKLEMRNCNIEGLGDDTLNIHGLATAVTDIENNTLKMIGRENSLYRSIVECTWAAAGDIIDAYDPETFLKVAQFTVLEQWADGTVVFSEPVGEIKKGAILANRTFYASVHLDGCTLRNTRARGILIQTENVLVENCYISGMSLAAMLFAPDIRFWWEVGPSKNVEIRNNVIEYCTVAPGAHNKAAIVFKASHEGDDAAYPAGVHNGIYIHGNYFKDIPRSAIFVAAAKNIRIENNEFNNCCCLAGETDSEYADYDIVAINCEDIEVCGNCSSRGDRTLFFKG
ncbi:MAG: right-handed parallel beta-helix repeat-containing protein [Clostridia bacterium]|nr:right-handed parallel beta-helix repeat-containing protein [Clostridia bacterium]